MKKTLIFTLAIGLLITLPSFAWCECATIQSGTIHASTGEVLTTGYDEWGYNYEAHIFNGRYCDYTRGVNPPADDGSELIMKWNDAWLSNKDCNGDGLLDRHFGNNSYKGSGAWCTNHQTGKVEWPDGSGKYKTWTYSCKIVAVPEDAVLDGTNWKTADGIIIGYAIWGDFAVTEEVYNDPSQGAHGKLYKTPGSPGLGQYK